MNYKIFIFTLIACVSLLIFPNSSCLSNIPMFTTLFYALRIRRLLYSGISRKSLYIKYLIPNIVNMICVTLTVSVIVFFKGDSFYFQTTNIGLIKGIIFTLLFLSAQVGSTSIYFYSAWDKKFSIPRAVAWGICYVFCCGLCYGIEEKIFSMDFHLILITLCTIVINILFYVWFKRVQIN